MQILGTKYIYRECRGGFVFFQSAAHSLESHCQIDVVVFRHLGNFHLSFLHFLVLEPFQSPVLMAHWTTIVELGLINLCHFYATSSTCKRLANAHIFCACPPPLQSTFCSYLRFLMDFCQIPHSSSELFVQLKTRVL